MNIYTFHVSGTHCPACKALIEDILSDEEGVKKVTVNLAAQTINVEFDREQDQAQLAEKWTKLLEPHKYVISLEKQEVSKEMTTLAYAIPLGVILLSLFVLLQKSGIVNFGFEGGLTPWTAILIGVIASLSSCLAIVGGLVLSLSATVSDDVKTSRPFIMFHIGRLLGFSILGGVLGLVGSAISISSTVTAVLGITAAIIMLVLGVNLLDVFHSTKKFQLALPKGIFNKIHKMENGFLTPMIIGAATFFLPCGFTQSMQFAALSSGSFLSGTLIMTSFAIGTLPMLAILSFGSFQFAHTKYAPLFFRTAGVVVIGFGLLAILAGLASLGIISPVINI